MRRITVTFALAGLLVAMMAAPSLAQVRGPSGADGTYNCEDFDTQESAQAFFESEGGDDPHGLDSDNDGVACESRASDGGGNGSDGADGSGQAPTGGVDTGFGGATTTGGPLALLVAALGLALIAGGTLARRGRA